ncbi:MAG: TolC family protein [Opitutaceae bacterium]|nr:TolC family protein [Opitutaceae bacterium]
MTRIFVLFVALVSAVFSAELSLDRAVEQAVANNRALAAAGRFEIEKAQGRALQAGLPKNPEIEVGGRSDLLFKNEGERTVSLGVSQAIARKGRLRLAREAANLSVNEQQELAREAERQLIGEVQTLYVQAVGFNTRYVARQKLIETGEKLAAIVEQRYQAGEVPQTDIAPIRIENAKLVQEQQLLTAEKTAAELKLKFALGLPPDEPLTLTSTVEDAAARWERESAVAFRSEARPDYQAAKARIAQAEANVRVAKAEAYDDITVGADFENERSVFDGPIGVKKDYYLGFKVSIPIPVRNKNQGRILEQQAAHRQAEAELDATGQRIASEVAQTRAVVAQLEPLLTRYRDELLPMAERHFQAVQRAYQQGQLGIPPVFQAQQQRFALELDYQSHLARKVEALIAIETATGAHPHVRTPHSHPHPSSQP